MGSQAVYQDGYSMRDLIERPADQGVTVSLRFPHPRNTPGFDTRCGMRKLVLVMVLPVVVLALALPAVAAAVLLERGDGTLAVKSATGRITITAKGTILGRVDDGVVSVTDLSPGTPDDIQVFGSLQKPVVRGNGATVYRGTGLRFRIVGGWYSIVVTGVGINLSAVGSGTVQGQGVSAGLFSTDALPFSTTSKGALSASFGPG